MNDRDKTNFYLVNIILLTAVGMGSLLNSYSSALYISHFSRATLPYFFIFSGAASVLVMWILIPFLATTNKKPILFVQILSIILVALYLILSMWPSKTLSLIYTFLFVALIPIYYANSWDIAEFSFELRVFKQITNKFLTIISVGCILSVFFLHWNRNFGKIFNLFSLLLMIINCIAVSKVKLLHTSFKSPANASSLRVYPLFMVLAGFIALINGIIIFANYQMMFRLSEALDMTQITKFMTLFYLSLNIAAFLPQFYAKRLLEGWGISMLFGLSTVIIFIFLIPSIFYPNLYNIALFNVVIWTVYVSLILLGDQVALNALPFGLKNKGQIMIGAIVVNVARIIASFGLLILAYRFQFYPYQVLTIFFLAIMLIFSWKIKKLYGETLLSTIKSKRFYLPNFDEQYDYNFLAKQVRNLLASDDPIKIRIGLSILKLKRSKSEKVSKELLKLFDNPDHLIRIEAYRASRDFKKIFVERLVQQLKKETNPEATWQLLHLILQRSHEKIMGRLDEYLYSSRPVYQAIAVVSAVKYGEFSQVRNAIETLEIMTNSNDEDAKLFAVMALKKISIGNPVELIEKLMNDSNYKIAKQAVKATYSMSDKRIARFLIRKLGTPNICHDAMQSLLKIKIDIAPLVYRSCLKINVQRYKPLIKVLCELNTLTTEKCLSRLIPKVPFLFSIELAKQIALRASKQPLSEQLKAVILSHIDEIIADLNRYNFSFINKPMRTKSGSFYFAGN